MRLTVLLALLACLFLAPPAFAGNIGVKDGKAVWQSTQCTPPDRLATPAHDPEIMADTVNTRVVSYNQYVTKVQEYMNCLSQEAQRDSDIASGVITGTAKTMIQKSQDDLVAVARELNLKPAEDVAQK